MIKFIHKKHAHLNPNTGKFVVYYNLSDIVLGFLLVILVAFFIYNYLTVSFGKTKPVAVSPASISSQRETRAK